MDATAYLLFLYAAIIGINVMVMYLLWRSARNGYYKTLMFSWFMGVAGLIASAMTAQQQPFLRALSFSLGFFVYAGMASVLSKIGSLNFRFRPFLGLPAICLGFSGIFLHWNRLSLALRGFAVTLFLNGLHAVDYAFAFTNPAFEKAGFTFGIALAIAFTLFGPGAGLGLSVSQGIAEAHGGSLVLDAQSKLPRFVLTLPKLAQRA